MPDMNEPLAHLEALVDRLKYDTNECRRKALEFSQRAECYQDAAGRAQDALDREKAKRTAVSEEASP